MDMYPTEINLEWKSLYSGGMSKELRALIGTSVEFHVSLNGGILSFDINVELTRDEQDQLEALLDIVSGRISKEIKEQL